NEHRCDPGPNRRASAEFAIPLAAQHTQHDSDDWLELAELRPRALKSLHIRVSHFPLLRRSTVTIVADLERAFVAVEMAAPNVLPGCAFVDIDQARFDQILGVTVLVEARVGANFHPLQLEMQCAPINGGIWIGIPNAARFTTIPPVQIKQHEKTA